ncbi:NAD(P)/FAD-dependent oxidoreductase [Bacillus xiapuensis]|uniref:NAD(P)/FAD-dependent oxidoreductase n=1 Tax=Bacillus xiapuensis TaxID=2014075 RepID=UPI000C240142|nr:NAD(P)/FAD-dependent oxidoreductase [Bacillus xiapuensis]
MQVNEQIYDITVIGGGPVGLFTAFYGGMRQASVKIIESLPQLGGQLSTLYPEKYIYDVAGFPKVKAQELVDRLTEQMKPFSPAICLEQSAQSLEKLADGTLKLTTDREVHFSKTLIITAGNGAFQPRKLQLPNAEAYEQTNLHYFVTELEPFRNKRVAICGGGDSAVDWALMLEPIAKEVTLIHRRDQFRAHEHGVEKLRTSRVNILTPFMPNGLIDQNGRISAIQLSEVKGDKQLTLPVDDLIVNFGFVSSLGPLKDWGLTIEKNSIIVNSKMETNIEAVYAAGDVCTYEGKVKLIASGFGEAPTAVNNAKAYLDPKARVQPMHSTSLFNQ